MQNSKFLFEFKCTSVPYSGIQNCSVPPSAGIVQCVAANVKWIW